MDKRARSVTSIASSQGYFKVPDFVFERSLPLSSNARLVLCYLCRRADKNGICFPSIKRICSETAIKSPNTVRKAIKELSTLNLISQLPPAKRGGSNRYVLSSSILEILKKSKRGEGVNEHKPYSTIEHPPSNIEHPPTQQLSTKEYTEKENTNKEGQCALNQVQLEEPTKELDEAFFDTHYTESQEFQKRLRGNLSKVAPRVLDEQGKRLQDMMKRKNDVSDEKMAEAFNELRRRIKSTTDLNGRVDV